MPAEAHLLPLIWERPEPLWLNSPLPQAFQRPKSSVGVGKEKEGKRFFGMEPSHLP